MKNSKIRIIVPCVLAVVFMVAGAWMMLKSYTQMRYYDESIKQARQELGESDLSLADAAEQKVAVLQEANEQMRQQVDALQKENAELETQTQQLQADYEALIGDEDTAYYQKILESLTEGMSKVEEYIRGS